MTNIPPDDQAGQDAADRAAALERAFGYLTTGRGMAVHWSDDALSLLNSLNSLNSSWSGITQTDNDADSRSQPTGPPDGEDEGDESLGIKSFGVYLDEAPSARITASRDDDGRIIEQLHDFDELRPLQARRLLDVWEEILRTEPRPRRRVNDAAYIAALRSVYLQLKLQRARAGGRRPSHAECAHIVGMKIEGETIRVGTSIKRLQRATPPTSWEELTTYWDKEVGQM